MILSPQGYPRDNGSSDFMDSARLAGMMITFTEFPVDNMRMHTYEVQPGILVRCPVGDAKETNPNNFTRDQLLVLVSGFNNLGYHDLNKRIFYAHLKRAFFCQNKDRDLPNTNKRIWPHYFINDRGEKVFKIFDYRDLLLLHDIILLIVAARLYWLYVFIPIGWISLLVALVFNYFAEDSEQNQIICICKVLGFVGFYKLLTPDWKERTHRYWDGWRDEPLMAHLIIGVLE